MALRFSSVIPPIVVRRRLPLIKTWYTITEQKVRTIRMETSSTTVPGIVVYVTVPNKEAGKKLAESIVRGRLAACVNRVPGVESIYEWKGEIQTDSEELLIIKTRASLLEDLTEHVKSNHEYEVPEVIALPITGGNLRYLEWLKNSTRDNDEQSRDYTLNTNLSSNTCFNIRLTCIYFRMMLELYISRFYFDM